MRKVKLFCFPYAGGSAVVYNNWNDQLGNHIRVYPVELAGRGARIPEPFYNSVDDAAEDVITRIKYDLLDGPYAFFGHSMGGAVAYRVTEKLKEKRYPQPLHIFFSGRGAPHVRREDKEPYHTLPHNEFKEKILELGGTPEEFFAHPELTEILLPLLRADFKISWMFTHQFGQVRPLDCDITVLVGKDDDLKLDQIEEWKMHTRRKYMVHRFEGGHFYLNDPGEREKMFAVINEILRGLVGQRISISA